MYLLEEVISFIIHKDKRREIFHFNFPDGFHSQFRIFNALQALDTTLRQYSCRTADTAKVEAAVLLAGIRHLLAAVAFRQHDHAAAVGLQLSRHRSPYGPAVVGPKRAGSITFRRFGRTCVVNRVIFNVLRQPFTVIQPLFQLGVGDIAAHDNRAVQRQACRNRILRQAVQRISFIGRFRSTRTASPSPALRSSSGIYLPGLCSSFSIQIPSTVDLRFDITVSRAGDAHTDRAGCTVTRQADHADVVSEVFTAKLRTQTKILRFDQQFFFQFHIAERLSVLIPFRWQFIIVFSGSQFHRFKVRFCRSSTNNERNMIRRTGRRTQRAHLLNQVIFQLPRG